MSLLLFIVAKFNHLSLPHFWDEAWVYAPAVQEMILHGPSLAPSSIPVELSRGHPLLFHFLAALWGKLFGSSLLSLHAFSLMISCIFILSAYYVSSKLYNQKLGVVVVFYLILQSIFFAQSSMLLPEILLAFFSLFAVFGIAQKNWTLYFVFAGLAILTKESGIVICAGGLLHMLAMHILKREKFLIKRMLLLLSPLLVFGIFILANKASHGWFLYPEHTDLLKLDPLSSLKSLKPIFVDHFIDQARFWILLSLVGITIYALKFTKQRLLLDSNQILLLSFSCSLILFSSLNFYTGRYMLPMYVPLILSFFAFANAYLTPKIFSCLSILLLCISGLSINDRRPIRDTNLSYLDFIPLQQEVVSYIESQADQKPIITCGFLTKNALRNKHAGYRNTTNVFSEFTANYEKNSILIYSNIETKDSNSIQVKKEFRPVLDLKKGVSWFKVYQNF